MKENSVNHITTNAPSKQRRALQGGMLVRDNMDGELFIIAHDRGEEKWSLVSLHDGSYYFQSLPRPNFQEEFKEDSDLEILPVDTEVNIKITNQ